MTSKVIYKGALRTECIHLQSKNSFLTDAPTDNHGLGEAFSPTDTVATALASCMLSIMGIKAMSLDYDMTNSVAKVQKTMASNPRRISKIEVQLTLPATSEKNQKLLEKAAMTCPVFYSLHPDIEKKIDFSWDL